ncbi:MAG: hypothetical protein ACYTDU_08320 [Planctomycetota bacterium]
MRVLVLFLLLVACVGCRSSRSQRPKRDYLSVNRTSYQFIKESARKARSFRRDNLKRTLDFKGRRPGNVQRGKESVQFAARFFTVGQWTEFKNMLRYLGEERKTGAARMDSIRFGHLDSGD